MLCLCIGRMPNRSSLVEPNYVSLQSPLQIPVQTSIPAVQRTFNNPRPTSERVAEVPKESATCVPFHVSSPLFQTYFRCIHPIWPVLYRPLYSTLDHTQLLNTLAPPLVYSILSLAVLIQDHQLDDHMSKHELAQQYFDCALERLRGSALVVEHSIANCQALAILALQQHSVGEFSQAGSLCASASYMAIELSLHRKSQSDHHVDVQVKSRLWWTVYTLEKMLSCEMSRPVLLRAEEADAPFPSADEPDEFEFYSESATSGIAMDRERHPLRLRTISAFHTSIRLAMIMEKVSRQVYSVSARQHIRDDRQGGEELRLRLWDDVHKYETLLEGSPLKLDNTENLTSVPVTVTNYVFMWSTTILLHRPFVDSWTQNNTEKDVSSSQNDPREICFSSAQKICSTIQRYAQFIKSLPCDLIFPIFVAANVLLRCWQQTGGQNTEVRLQLDLCVKWLNGLAKSWKGAESRRNTILECERILPSNSPVCC